MAKYVSRFKELAFHVEKEVLKFKNGVFETKNAKHIKVLEKLQYASKVEEPKAVAAAPKEAPVAEAPKE